VQAIHCINWEESAKSSDKAKKVTSRCARANSTEALAMKCDTLGDLQGIRCTTLATDTRYPLFGIALAGFQDAKAFRS
jgi:hypothetical protein